MGKAVIEELSRLLALAYERDRFHAFRKNLADVTEAEWAIRPANASIEVFGSDPELSIGDTVLHVGGAKWMYGNRAFGDGSLQWGGIALPGTDRETVEAWLDEGHRAFAAGLAALTEDANLEAERTAPWGAPMRVGAMVRLVINHDLYHAGEVNRQRALIRGAEGWER